MHAVAQDHLTVGIGPDPCSLPLLLHFGGATAVFTDAVV